VRLDHILIAAVADIGVTAAAADTVVVAGNAAAAAVAAAPARHHMIFAGLEYCSKPAQSAQRNRSLYLPVQIRMYQH